MASSPQDPRPPIGKRVSLRIELTYAIAAGIYICFSDQLLVRFVETLRTSAKTE